MSEWISVDDRLPDEYYNAYSRFVAVRYKNLYCDAKYNFVDCEWLNRQGVTIYPSHWSITTGAAQMNDWISIDDLSLINDDNCGDVFWVTDGVDVERGFLRDKRTWTCLYTRLAGDITHWMPITIPELPK